MDGAEVVLCPLLSSIVYEEEIGGGIRGSWREVDRL